MSLPLDDRLWTGRLPANPRGLVLLLHGGAEHGLSEVDHRSLAYRRTRWMAATIRGPLAARDVGTAVLRFRLKGWSARRGTGAGVPAPVQDAREALGALRAGHPDVPLVLLGHSMGGRTAAWVADEPGVVGVVGLAPWWPVGDPVDALGGTHVVGVHGRRDRITSARATAQYLARAEAVAASTRFVDMGPHGHYMLSAVRRWNTTAIAESLRIVDTVAGVTSPD